MIALVQRVTSASVTVEEETVGAIDGGFLLYLGVVEGDRESDIEKLVEKIVSFRIFDDEKGRFDRSLIDVGGAVLLVSQFTLAGSWKKGRRPGFDRAMTPEQAAPMVERFGDALRAKGLAVAAGRFGAHMKVASVNDGPVTFVFDTDNPV